VGGAQRRPIGTRPGASPPSGPTTGRWRRSPSAWLSRLSRGEAHRRRTAVLCAEALWWRCHRRVISDAVVVRAWRLVHLPQRRPNDRSPMARVDADGTLIYDRLAPDNSREG